MTEGGGYIPQTEAEAHDPRFEMAITCDIHPGEDVKQAAKFNFKLGKGGIPPMLRSNGKITEAVAIDNEKGIGYSYSTHGLVGSMGFRILMKPSTFLSLAASMGPWAKPEYQAKMNDYLKAGNPIAAPTIRFAIPKQWEQGDYTKPATVRGHEGRHRMTAIMALDGDVLTEVICRICDPNGNVYSANQVKPDWLRHINASCITQDDWLKGRYKATKGPFFKMNNNMFEGKDKFTKKTDFRFNKGALLMQRLGPINAQKQTHDSGNLPPVKRGMWAFPYPAFDIFFAYHKVNPLLPADLRSENISAVYDKAKAEGKENDEDFREAYQSIWDMREKAIEKLKDKMRPKTFWWDGPIYSHVSPHGGINDVGQSWYLWTDLKAWARAANKSMIALDSFKGWGEIKVNPTERGFPTYSVDHLEVFLPEKADITKQKKGRR